MARPNGVTKRRAEVPRAARALAELVSKADLLEIVWDVACTTHKGGCDDLVGGFERLIEILNEARERQGRRKLSAKTAESIRDRHIGSLAKGGA